MPRNLPMFFPQDRSRFRSSGSPSNAQRSSLTRAARSPQMVGNRAVDAPVVRADVLRRDHAVAPVPANDRAAWRVVDQLDDLRAVELRVELVEPAQTLSRGREKSHEDRLPVAELAVDNGIKPDVESDVGVSGDGARVIEKLDNQGAGDPVVFIREIVLEGRACRTRGPAGRRRALPGGRDGFA